MNAAVAADSAAIHLRSPQFSPDGRRVYAASGDPWGFTSRWYEERKYALSLAMLPRRRYAEAVESFLAEKMPVTYEAFVANDRVAP